MGGAKTMKLSEARGTFSSLVNDVFRNQKRVIVEKSGIPVVAVVSISDLKLLERFDEDRRSRAALLEGYSRQFDEYSLEKIEAEVTKAIAEDRADRSGERAAR
jgi:prevent-host-death family protein